MSENFETLSIHEGLARKLRERGIEEPTPIQAEAIPPILAGKDVVAQSQTGTGKTLAYALPIVQKLDPELKKLQALVIVPTQELGMQIAAVLDDLTAGTGLVAQTLIGGASLQRQLDKLKLHPQVVVGTPGRVLEVLRLKKLSMHNVRTIVVDEVDQVFALGAMNDVETIFKSALRDRQLLFFSATVPDTMQAVIERWMREPHHVKAGAGGKAAGTLEHLFVVCEERNKIDTVRRLVRMFNPRSAIVFTNEIDKLAEIVAKLQYVGLSAEALYGEAGKQERERVMKGFRSGRFQLLLATDVASRGLDIPDVTHVINLDLPIDADHYVHRAGRTGRMGRSGTVISISSLRERFIIDKFAKALDVPFVQKELFGGSLVDPARAKRPAAGGGDRGQAGQERKPFAETAGRTREDGQEQPDRNRKPVSGGEGGFSPRTERTGDDKAVRHTAETKGVRASSKEAPKRGLQPKPDKGRAASPANGAGKAKSDRQRDRKNKGAPRWLKEKSEQDRTT
ncbi:DEAD/DEAH box helicase [Paenibacillus sp. MBLB4367]|uniref:DEAD/DEAH box helicase n=1 Tax=Paenibacillus sp. MBLB4367 TaxID=3384767 RepID=UPI0039080178